MVTNNESKKVVTNSLFWRFSERILAQLVSFVVSILLARILSPDDYGTIALVMVFITILQVFVDSGLGNALVQKKESDDVDFSSVFYFNILACTLLYFAIFLAAPLVADFYNRIELIALIRVLSITLLISGVKNVQQAYILKHLLFKKFFFSTLGGTIVAAFIGIYLANNGFGVWALVAQNLFNQFIDTVILWVTVKWRPKRVFSFIRIKSLFSYGWKLLVSSLINVGYNELRSLIIGKKYSSEDLAYYNRGAQFPQLIVENINTSIDSVLLPTLSSEQDNRDIVRRMTRRAIKVSTFIMMPVMVGLAVCAEPIVRLVLTEKWISCVFFLRIFCFTFAFYPIHTANLNAIKAMGRSDVFLKLEIIKKVIGLLALLLTMFISVKAMALSLLITSTISQLINSAPNKRLLKYSFVDQIKDIAPQIAISIIMGLLVFSVSLFHINDIVKLIIQIPLGICVYVGMSYLLKIDSLDYCLTIIKSYFNKKKNR